jgi:hypothetical protein
VLVRVDDLDGLSSSGLSKFGKLPNLSLASILGTYIFGRAIMSRGNTIPDRAEKTTAVCGER